MDRCMSGGRKDVSKEKRAGASKQTSKQTYIKEERPHRPRLDLRAIWKRHGGHGGADGGAVDLLQVGRGHGCPVSEEVGGGGCGYAVDGAWVDCGVVSMRLLVRSSCGILMAVSSRTATAAPVLFLSLYGVAH